MFGKTWNLRPGEKVSANFSMKRYYYYLWVVFIVCGFSQSCNTLEGNNPEQKSKDEIKHEIVGKWITRDSGTWIPIILFEKNTVTFYPIGDTILHFYYHLQGNVITLKTLDSVRTYNDTVVFLEANKLKLRTIAGVDNSSTYIKQ